MIQEADIGIGIYGQEGLRAVQASDFAVGEFRCLWKLLLVHGRWCYLRIAEMILYFFYKNILMTLPQFFFSFYCGFSGQTIFDDWYITLYNLIFTCFPLIVRGILDQDIHYKKNQEPQDKSKISPKGHIAYPNANQERTYIKKFYPKLYYIGQKNNIFNLKAFVYWILSAIFHSLILFLACLWTFQYNALGIKGYNSDLWSFSITGFTLVILTVSLRLGLYTKNWTILFIFSFIFLSLTFYFSYVFVSNSIKDFLVYQSIVQTFEAFIFYGVIFLIPGFFFSVDLFILVVVQEYQSSLSNYFRILIKTGQENEIEYFSELNKDEPLNLSNKNPSRKKFSMPRPSIFFEALELKKIKDDFLKKKQFNFINIVKVKSGNFSSSHQYDQNEEIKEEKEINEMEEEDLVFSEDCFIRKRSSSMKSRNKITIE